ncbi:MAG: T9SS type A sorting domain-containing protein [Chitinophagaceae bacterium]|nr:T9SS type A sorting domain-containing protein [Chitinophagaceae bacterium]
MKQKIYLFLIALFFSFGVSFNAKAQCLAGYTLWQDTSMLAQPHTYIGSNTCISPFFSGIDTINFIYTWTWGDGTSSTGPFPSHTYASAGNYQICVVMSGSPSGGCIDTFCSTQAINKNRAIYSVNIKNPFVTTQTQDIAKPVYALFPNPVLNQLSIKGLAKGDYTISIYGADGSLKMKQNISSTESISTIALSSGIYFIRLSDQNTNKYLGSFTKQ